MTSLAVGGEKSTPKSEAARNHLLVTVDTMADAVTREREECAVIVEAAGYDDLAGRIRAKAKN